MIKLLPFLFIFLCFESFSQPNLCNQELETFPTRSGGREKPLFVLAEETIKFITGENRVEGLTATETFCKLSLKAFGMPINLPLKVRVDHIEAKKLLGVDENSSSIDINVLIEKMGLLESELAGLKENNSFKKELNKIKQRKDAYEAIVDARLWTIPERKGDKLEFVSLKEFLTQNKVMAAREKTGNPVEFLFDQARNDYLKIRGDAHLLELTYFKLNLFLWAMLTSLLAIITLVALRNKWIGISFTFFTVAIEVIAMSMRVLISGRAPITNMYETVMFSGFGALMIGCLIALLRKEIIFIITGLAFNVLSLMMMKFAGNMLDPSISPLVPVLRDNFWLSTHVTTVILSYAALALSWLIANGLMIRDRFFVVSSAQYRYGVDLAYTCIKVGIVLLAAGIILGGVWADYSWGRFWGWDPKETWSLIVLLIYMAILHGKYTSWIPPQRFIPLVAAAFMSVMMAWFGVNYILASGLHSYGFSEGGAVFLGSFFALQIAVLALDRINLKANGK